MEQGRTWQQPGQPQARASGTSTVQLWIVYLHLIADDPLSAVSQGIRHAHQLLDYQMHDTFVLPEESPKVRLSRTPHLNLSCS